MVTFEFVLKPCKMYSFNTNIAGLITGVTDAELGYGVKSSVHRSLGGFRIASRKAVYVRGGEVYSEISSESLSRFIILIISMRCPSIS